MPAPCPQPRPVRTTELPTVDVEYHLEGTVCGRRMPLAVNVGYRAGSRQWAHAFMELRKSVSVSVVEALPPLTTMFPPILDTEVTDPPLQWPAARRNRATSPNGSVTVQWESGDAPSSCSLTGRRYGSGADPKTLSLPTVVPFDVEKYTVSAGRPLYRSTWPVVASTAFTHRSPYGPSLTPNPRYTWHASVAHNW